MARRGLPVAVALAVAVAGCGGSKTSSPVSTTSTRPVTSSPATTTAPPAATNVASPSPLTPEAQSAATGDIPDNQAFLTFHNAGGGYSMKYPEGWGQQGSGKQVTFRDKNNIVRVVIEQAPPPTPSSVSKDLAHVAGVTVTSPPKTMTVSGKPAIKVVYTTQSAPNAVTGKRVKLIVDRYYLWRGGKVTVVDLGTPEGVDNVDAYRRMIESFRWL